MAENAVSMRVCAPLPWITFGRVLYCIDHEYLTFLFVVDFYGSFTGKKSPTLERSRRNMSRQELVKESVIVRSILNHLKSMPDCFAWKEHGGMYGTAGIPDIICCIGGRFFAFEVKNEKGTVTKLQEATIDKIKAAGGTAAVVRSVEDVKHVVGRYSK